MSLSQQASTRRRPRQSRSRAMVEFILQGADRLFAELGYDAVTTKKIADRAGVSIGSLYQYFPNKEGVLLWAVKRRAARPRNRIDKRRRLWRGSSSREDRVGRRPVPC